MARKKQSTRMRRRKEEANKARHAYRFTSKDNIYWFEESTSKSSFQKELIGQIVKSQVTSDSFVQLWIGDADPPDPDPTEEASPED